MAKFVKAALVSDIPEGGTLRVVVDGVALVLARVDGRFYALEDACTHDGGPLGEGRLEGSQIRCPRHGARFDVRSGQVLSLPAVEPAPTYEVRVEGDEIQVAV